MVTPSGRRARRRKGRVAAARNAPDGAEGPIWPGGSLHEALDTTTPGGRLIFDVFAALAEFRELIVEGTREGLDAARARGVRLGRPPAMTAEQIQHARDLLARPENTVSAIARLLGASRATIYKYVPELAARSLAADNRPLPDVAKFELLPSRQAAVITQQAECS